MDCRICTRKWRDPNSHDAARRRTVARRTEAAEERGAADVIKAIAEARAHGDLSENAEYHAAREQQSFIEGPINLIENRLSNCEVIDVTKLTANGRVVFGSTLELEDQDGGNKVVYQLVGDDEANIKQGLLSVSSPIARALIGKSEGDVVDVTTPGGTRATKSCLSATCREREDFGARVAGADRALGGQPLVAAMGRGNGVSFPKRSACRGSHRRAALQYRDLPGARACRAGTAVAERARFLLGFVAVALLAFNEWVLKAAMTRAQTHGGSAYLSFGAWHGISAGLYVLACLCVLVLLYKDEYRHA